MLGDNLFCGQCSLPKLIGVIRNAKIEKKLTVVSCEEHAEDVLKVLDVGTLGQS